MDGLSTNLLASCAYHGIAQRGRGRICNSLMLVCANSGNYANMTVIVQTSYRTSRMLGGQISHEAEQPFQFRRRQYELRHTID
jgi:hypothetical protein